MKVYFGTQVLKQGINNQTNCAYYTLKFRNMKLHLL